MPKKKIQKLKGMVEQGLVSALPSTALRAQGASNLHSHELDVFDNSTGPQISRVRVLSLDSYVKHYSSIMVPLYKSINLKFPKML